MAKPSLISIWQSLLRDEGLPADPGDRLGTELLARWQESHRLYHTTEHLQNCLQWWDKTRNLLQEPTLAGFVLFYHDAIYDPRRSDNEAASAELARMDLVDLGMDSTRISQVCALVRATDHKTQADHPDVDLVIDIDLAILGADPQTYQSYFAAIRREYAHIDENGWRGGRAKVLQGFLNKPRIFACHFFDECERKARLNLAQELRELSE